VDGTLVLTMVENKPQTIMNSEKLLNVDILELEVTRDKENAYTRRQQGIFSKSLS